MITVGVRSSRCGAKFAALSSTGLDERISSSEEELEVAESCLLSLVGDAATTAGACREGSGGKLDDLTPPGATGVGCRGEGREDGGCEGDWSGGYCAPWLDAG